MNNYINDKIAEMEESGIRKHERLSVILGIVGGTETVTLTEQEMNTYIDNPIKFAADRHKVSIEDYTNWIATDGSPRCGATTKSGRICKNHLSGGGQRPINEWLELDGGLCATHGGESSTRTKY